MGGKLRNIAKKAVRINTWYYIIALSSFLALFYLFMPTDANAAISRDDYNQLKTDRVTLKDSIVKSDEKIAEIRTQIIDQEKVVRDLKSELDKVITGNDWESISKKIELEKEHNDAQILLSKYREDLLTNLTNNSNLTKQVKDLDVLISDSVITSGVDLTNLAKKIGITITDTCITAIQNNVTNPCGVTYKDLITLDSSDTQISGKFATDKNNFFHRAEPKYKQSWRAYDSDESLRIFVDPPSGMAQRMKMIHIMPNFDTYLIAGKTKIDEKYEYVDYTVTKGTGNNTSSKVIQVLNKTQDYARVLYHDRYVDDRCMKAMINADKLDILLADTINYMRNNCQEEHTSFVNIELIPIDFTYIDITTTASWQYNQWMEHVKNFCIFKFKAC